MITAEFVKKNCLAPGVEINDEQAERLVATINQTILPHFKNRPTPVIIVTEAKGFEYKIDATTTFHGTMD